LDTKIKWNQMLRNKIEKQNQLQKDINKKIAIKKWLKLIQKQTKKTHLIFKRIDVEFKARKEKNMMRREIVCRSHTVCRLPTHAPPLRKAQ
jgi:hypothetical protein